MRRIFKRALAYVIDMMVVTIIAQSLSGIPIINPQLDNYDKYYDEYIELLENYGAFKVDLTSDFEDKKLSEEEYQELVEEHEEYQNLLTIAYEDGELTKKEYDKINTQIDENYQKEYKKVYYKIEQNSIAYFVIYLIVTLAYFIGFNKITAGQTLGKKLTRLKIVSAKEDKKVPAWSYLVRTLILYQPIYYLVKLIGVNTLSMNNYYNVTTIFYDIQYYLEIIIIVTIMLRLDGRGIHDLLAKTKVIALDREGNEIEEKNTSYLDKKLAEEKEKRTKNKVIDEEPTE